MLAVASCRPAEQQTIDLAGIDRCLVKEPGYQHQPKYFLLVFGPQAKTRAWVVIDAVAEPASPHHTIYGSLYVDRNASGDLTEPGNRIPIKTGDELPPRFEDVLLAGDEGRTAYRLRVYAYPHLPARADQAYTAKYLDVDPIVEVQDLANRRSYRIGAARSGALTGSSRPAETPVVHIGGPLEMGLGPVPVVKKRNGAYEVRACVMAKVSGRGVVAHLQHTEGGIPPGVCPTAILEFAPRARGSWPHQLKVVLKSRC
jgi:hypothetical protein